VIWVARIVKVARLGLRNRGSEATKCYGRASLMTTPMDAVALVSGGNGFIGSVVARALPVAFAEVRAGTRRAGREQSEGVARGLRYVPCDLDKPEEIRRAVAGAAWLCMQPMRGVRRRPRRSAADCSRRWQRRAWKTSCI